MWFLDEFKADFGMRDCGLFWRLGNHALKRLFWRLGNHALKLPFSALATLPCTARDRSSIRRFMRSMRDSFVLEQATKMP